MNEQQKTYSIFIGALAQKFTATPEEADAARQEIYADIIRYAAWANTVASPQDKIVSLLARRRLSKYLRDH